MAKQFFKRGTDVFELGEQGERKLGLPEFKSLGLNFDFLKEGQPVSEFEGKIGRPDDLINQVSVSPRVVKDGAGGYYFVLPATETSPETRMRGYDVPKQYKDFYLKEVNRLQQNDVGSLINSEMVNNGQDPFNLEDKDEGTLQRILSSIESQINQPQQNQQNILNILNQQQEATGLKKIQDELFGLRESALPVQQAQTRALEETEERPLTGTILRGGLESELANIAAGRTTESLPRIRALREAGEKEKLLVGREESAREESRFRTRLVADEMKELRGRPKELIDFISKAFGIQKDIAGEKRAEAQEKRAVEKALADAKKENRPKFEQVGDTLLRIDPDGKVTPVFRGGDRGGIKFTDTQIAKGATSSRLGVEAFSKLSTDTKNYFINRSKEMDENFASIDRRIKNGDTRQEIEDVVFADLDAAGLAPNVATEIKSVMSLYLETKKVSTEKKPGVVEKAVGAVKSWWSRLF